MSNINIDNLANKYVEFIKDEGYKIEDSPTRDNDNDIRVVVKFEGASIIMYFDCKDTHFVRIILPNFYSLDDIQEKRNALIAIDKVAKTCKVAKVHTTTEQTNVYALVEFLENENGTAIDQNTLIRYLSMAKNAASTFATQMKAL